MMKLKLFLFAASLCCTLPCMTQGANDKQDPPDPPEKSLKLISVETDFETVMIHFRINLGEICVSLQEVTGIAGYSQSIDTSMQRQVVLAAPAGTYILIISDTAGNMIQQVYVVIS